MHTELDRLRRELKQRIFVGEPGGETFLAAAPDKVLEAKRIELAAEAAETPAARRKTPSNGPTTLDDY